MLPNPKTTYKALLLDYDALLTASDDECCYSLSEREVQIILAMVDYVAWKTRYIVTATEINQATINAWSGNLARKLMSGCCPDDGALHRFSAQGIYQTSIDGGLTWEDDPEGDPRNDYVESPPLPGFPSDGKRCAAADNVRDLFRSYRDNLVSILTATPLIIEIVSGILAFIAVITGVSGVGIGISVVLLGLAAALAQMTPGEVTAAITEIVLDDFRCLVYCRMNDDGELTYEAWQALLVDLSGQFSGFQELFFYQTVNGMGYIGVNNAGTIGAATADDCEDCGCTDCPCNLNAWNWSPSYGSPEAAEFTRTPESCSLTADGLYHDVGTGLYYFGVYAPTGCTMYAGIVSGSVNTFHGYIPAAYTGPYSWFDTSSNWVSGIIPGPANARAIIMISTVPFAPYAAMA